MGCKDFFSDNAHNPERCKLLQKMPRDEVLSFEKETASDLSTHGPVADEELLWRQIVNPVHYDAPNGQLKATAFSDVSDKGGSVNRGFANKADLLAAAQKRVETMNARRAVPDASLIGLVALECGAVRAIETPPDQNGNRLRGFIVVDTALPHDPSHADICQIVSQPGHSRSVRSALVELANDYLQKNSPLEV